MDLKLDVMNKHLLEDIIDTAKQKTLLVSSMIFSVGPTNFIQYPSKLYLVNMKLITVLKILYYSAYYQNTKYQSL